MIGRHPSEAELQQFALGENSIEKNISKHIADCLQCQAQVDSYRVMFTVIRQEEKPSFNFNLSETVLAELQPEKTQRWWDKLFGYAIVLVMTAVLGAAWYWFGSSFSELFKGVSSLLLSLIVIVAIFFLVFQCIDIYKTYRKKISVLDVM